jgi:hypothetical protein
MREGGLRCVSIRLSCRIVTTFGWMRSMGTLHLLRSLDWQHKAQIREGAGAGADPMCERCEHPSCMSCYRDTMDWPWMHAYCKEVYLFELVNLPSRHARLAPDFFLRAPMIRRNRFGVDSLVLLLLFSLISSCLGEYIIDDRDSSITYFPTWEEFSDGAAGAYMGTT